MIILQGVSIEELLTKIEELIERKLTNQKIDEKEPKYRYLTRKEVSKFLKITLPTLHNWTKEGYVKSYKIGSRVLYRSNEIEEAISITKYKRHS